MTDSEKLDLILAGMTGLQSDVAELKSDVAGLKSDVAELKSDVAELKVRVDSIDARLKTVEMTLENETNKNIQLLAENHGMLIDKLNQAIKVSDKTAMYEIQVNILTGKVERLEQEVREMKTIYTA